MGYISDSFTDRVKYSVIYDIGIEFKTCMRRLDQYAAGGLRT